MVSHSEQVYVCFFLNFNKLVNIFFVFSVNLTKYANEMPSACNSNEDFQTYREGIRHTYDDRCFYFIDKVYDCGNSFISSMKTNVAKAFKKSLEKDENQLNQIDRDGFYSPDQLSDISSICNGTIQDCFQNVKPLEPCEGYALEKALNCSMNDYVYKPSTYFRCNESVVVKMKKSGQSPKNYFQKYHLYFSLISICMLSS